MGKLEDLSGQKFGQWTVIRHSPEFGNRSTKWLCRCSCGKMVSVRACHLLRGATVSCGCAKPQLISAAKTGSKRPDIKRNKECWETRECKQCGKKIEIAKKEIRHGWGNFCSRRCAWDFRKHKEIKCEICGSVVRANKRVRFCSLRCMGEWKRTDPSRHVTISCKCCGKTFVIVKKEIKRRNPAFCSGECWYAWARKNQKRGKDHPCWRGGDVYRGDGWNYTAELIRMRDARSCLVCRAYQGKKRFPVDHIVPYRIAKENEPINLMTLCTNHHGYKTGIEYRLVRGDVMGFCRLLREAGWPMDIVSEALLKYGFNPS